MRTTKFVALALESFSVDTDTRTITGIAVPYGTKQGNGYRFERGALQFSDASRIKLNVGHDGKAVGVATSIVDKPSGLQATFHVPPSHAGDDALSLASAGVLDGLSIEAMFDDLADTVPDPRYKAGRLVQRAQLTGVALTGSPAFEDARVTRVAMHQEIANLFGIDPRELTVEDTDTTPATTPEPAAVPATFTAEQLEQIRSLFHTGEAPAVVNPVRPTAVTSVREALPYTFDRRGMFANVRPGDHLFSADIRDMYLTRDVYGESPAGRRVMDTLRAKFAVDPTITSDVDELNPTLQRPDMYVDLRPYRYPIWNAINKGNVPNGVQPFTWPKRSSSTIAVGTHSEGTEPEGRGIVTATGGTVTPTAMSGKASITREVLDMGGNPAVSNLIMTELQRSWAEGLEQGAATFVQTLTSATAITLTDATDDGFRSKWSGGLVDIQFVRSYEFSLFVTDKYLFRRFARLIDGSKRPLYPMQAPQNANGTTASQYRYVDADGYTVLPAWALQSTAVTGSANNSWLIEPAVVWGWASGPQRLEFPGTNSTGGYAPVAMVDIAVFGYQAFANTDIGGVRKVVYTPQAADLS